MKCGCPRGAALPSIPVSNCPESMGQIQKLIFMRLYNGQKLNEIENPKELATWTELLAATDSTKAVITPFIVEPTAESGEARTYGGGNASVGGIEEIIGANPTPFTARIEKSPQDTIKALKELMCENLGVVFVDEYGNLGMQNQPTTTSGDLPTTTDHYKPIPIRALFVGDKTLGGFEAPDSNPLQFSLVPNWSDDFVLVEPEFNPLYDLVAPTE